MKIPKHFEPYPEPTPSEPFEHTAAEVIEDVGVPGGVTGPNGTYPKVEPEEPPEGFVATPPSGEGGGASGDETRPWDDMTTHAALDGFLADNTDEYEFPETPVGWATMTILQKKAWLDENEI